MRKHPGRTIGGCPPRQNANNSISEMSHIHLCSIGDDLGFLLAYQRRDIAMLCSLFRSSPCLALPLRYWSTSYVSRSPTTANNTLQSWCTTVFSSANVFGAWFTPYTKTSSKGWIIFVSSIHQLIVLLADDFNVTKARALTFSYWVRFVFVIFVCVPHTNILPVLALWY